MLNREPMIGVQLVHHDFPFDRPVKALPAADVHLNVGGVVGVVVAVDDPMGAREMQDGVGWGRCWRAWGLSLEFAICADSRAASSVSLGIKHEVRSRFTTGEAGGKASGSLVCQAAG